MENLVIIWGLVIICFLFFFLWLFSMAMCPDKLVYWVSEAGTLRTVAKLSRAGLRRSGPHPLDSDETHILPASPNLPQPPLHGILIHHSNNSLAPSVLDSDILAAGSGSVQGLPRSSLPIIQEGDEPPCSRKTSTVEPPR